MTFIDQRLPEKYALQAVASDDWTVEIVETMNRRERRNLPSSDPRRAWDLSVNAKLFAERAELHQWFMAMRGPFHSFAFRDPADYVMARQALVSLGDSPDVAFQLAKAYTIGAETYRRTITKPVTASVQVWVGGVLQGSGWSVSRTTGVLTFSAAPGATVEASCEFDVPVRFAQSRLSWNRVDRNVSSGDLWMCDELSLIEVLGE